MNFIGGSRAHYTMTPPYTSWCMLIKNVSQNIYNFFTCAMLLFVHSCPSSALFITSIAQSSPHIEHASPLLSLASWIDLARSPSIAHSNCASQSRCFRASAIARSCANARSHSRLHEIDDVNPSHVRVWLHWCGGHNTYCYWLCPLAIVIHNRFKKRIGRFLWVCASNHRKRACSFGIASRKHG